MNGPFTYIGRGAIRFFNHLGGFAILIYQILRSLSDFSTYVSLTGTQMMRIGVRSLPIVVLASAFTGMVASVQSGYQFRGYAPLYLIGSVVGESVLLELGPVLTALLLSGRVGASIAAELGTMKVTEQIDALESLAFNSISYLVIPRVIAGVVMLPVLTIFADAVGITGGWLVATSTMNLSSHEFFKGLRMFFIPWDVIYGLIKSLFFGLTITLVACYQGFIAGGGAEGVGRATTNTVVICCVSILIINYVLASVLL